MLETGDVTVPVDYGPLPRLWPAVFLQISGYGVHYNKSEISWVPGILPQAGQEILYLQNSGDALIQRARLAMLPLSLLLGLAIYRNALLLWGSSGALLSLFAWSFSPTLLAHSRLLTSDFPVAAFLFLCISLGFTFGSRWAILRFLGSGFFLGLAMLSKVSACFAVPIVVGIWVYRGLSGRDTVWYPFRKKITLDSVSRNLLRSSTALLLIGLGAVAVVWGFYGFRYSMVPPDDPLGALKTRRIEEMREETTLESPLYRGVLELGEKLHILPEPYLLTLRYSLHHMQRRLSFFMGKRSIEGFPAYFPTALLIKTPLGLLILFLLALANRRRIAPGYGALFIFPTLYFAYTLSAKINIGHRYLLPIYPFLLLYLGGAFKTESLARKAIGSLAAASLMISSFWIHPDPLTYFNLLVGGPRGGIAWLGDSSLDWGQDLSRLPQWMVENGVKKVKLGYFGTALPEAYGIEFQWLPSVGFRNDRRPLKDSARARRYSRGFRYLPARILLRRSHHLSVSRWSGASGYHWKYTVYFSNTGGDSLSSFYW